MPSSTPCSSIPRVGFGAVNLGRPRTNDGVGERARTHVKSFLFFRQAILWFRRIGGKLGLGYVIVLERELDGIEPRDVDGRTLAKHRHALDAVAHEMDLPGLGEFVAFSQAEADALADDMKFDAPTAGGGRWFVSANGLEVVRSIRTYLQENPDEIEDADAVLQGLQEMQSVLEAAHAADTRFRLSIDY